MELSFMVIDSKPYLIEISDRTLGLPQDNLDRQQMSGIYPSRYIDEYYANVHPRIEKMVSRLGLKFGAIFLQGFWDNGDIYFYDPGLRFPGADYEDVVLSKSGFDIPKTFVEFAMTGNIKSCCGNISDLDKMSDYTSYLLCISCHPGIIGCIKGLESLSHDSRICSISQRYVEGEEIPNTGDVRQRVCEFAGAIPKDEDIRDFSSIYIQNYQFLTSMAKI